VFAVEIQADEEMRMIAVRGMRDSVAAFEASLKSLDVPSELESVLRQLKGIFPYQGFRLWETIVLRTWDFQGHPERGPKRVRGRVSEAANDIHDLEYEFGFRSATTVPDDGGLVVRIDLCQSGEGTEPQRMLVASIRTDIDVRVGQKVVVGKANVGASAGALFLVVTAKVE
jgi:hypothetical protein